MDHQESTTQLVDIGANLTHESFSTDFDQVLETAWHAGVTQLMVTGASQEGSQAAARLAQRYPGLLFATAGIHPHHAEESTPRAMAELKQLAEQAGVRAVGETGLDFFRDFSPRPLQEQSFEAHIALAIELNMPMFLHERDAYPRFAEIIQSHRSQLDKLVVHCFTADKEALFAYLDLDCHIGITGWICDERRGAHLLDLVQDIPPDRLMIETDAPYLMPRTIRPRPKSRRNEPRYLTHVCTTVAEARGQTYEELANLTAANARTFFDLPEPTPSLVVPT